MYNRSLIYMLCIHIWILYSVYSVPVWDAFIVFVIHIQENKNINAKRCIILLWVNSSLAEYQTVYVIM